MSQLRHYEIVFLVHPEQSEQVPNTIKRYEAMITSSGGKIHRLEDWGKRTLVYPIKKMSKAHYVLMNIECNDQTLKEISNNFRYNDAIIRNIILKCDAAITEPSPILTQQENKPLDLPPEILAAEERAEAGVAITDNTTVE
jgi:small subunit ribosomal protein S6